MPVLPEVASSSVRPDSRPRRSASATIPHAARSLTEPPGLNHSALPRTSTPSGTPSSPRTGTRGVRPMRSTRSGACTRFRRSEPVMGLPEMRGRPSRLSREWPARGPRTPAADRVRAPAPVAGCPHWRSVGHVAYDAHVILAGDVGGTKTHLALFTRDAGARRPAFDQRYPSRDHASLEDLVRAFLVEAGSPAVTRAAFGIAGVVVGNRCETTNLPWHVDGAIVAG